MDNQKQKQKEIKGATVRYVDGMRDRCGVTFNRKVQVSEFEPAEVGFWYSTDQMEGETVEQMTARAISIGSKSIAPIVKKMIDAKKHNSS